MYIRFLKKHRYHKKGDIFNTTNGAGEFLVQRKIAEEMVEDYLNDDKLMTAKEYEIRDKKMLEERDKKFEEEKEKEEKELQKKYKEQQDLIDIEDEFEETPPKRKRGRPRKSPINKMTNTNTLTTK